MRNEADTRAELIDPKLVEAGWGVVENSFIRREVIAPGRIIGGGKHAAAVTSDYVLRYCGRKLAAVEAKKESRNGARSVTWTHAPAKKPTRSPAPTAARSPVCARRS